MTGGPLRDRLLLLDPAYPTPWQREMIEGRFDAFIYDTLAGRGGVDAATVWDVGAHIGYHSLAFAALVGPRGRVVAFEPNRHNVDRLQEQLQRNPDLGARITLMTCALSDRDGTSLFLSSPTIGDGTSSGSHLVDALAPQPQEDYRSFTRDFVETAKADTLLRSTRVPPPTVIKMDVEGAEHLVLHGAVELLSRHPVTVFLEIHHVRAMFHVQQLLLGLGYTTTLLDAGIDSPSRCFMVATPPHTRL